MPKERRKVISKPSQAYLVSFGDTMTALLAFFIVLNSLAKEQTGANLHAGTGSFVSAVRGLGVAGLMDKNQSSTPIDAPASKPIYSVDDDGKAEEAGGSGPDEDDNGISVIDRQQEMTERIVSELTNLFSAHESNSAQTEVAIDIFESLGKKPEIVGTDTKKVLLKCLPLIKNPAYRIEVIVWSPTPSKSAWNRSALLAGDIREQLVQDFKLNSELANRIGCSARTWPNSIEKRPTITVRVIKLYDKS